MRMCVTIVTSVSVLSLPSNRSSPYPISMTSSTRFRLAELTAVTEISEPIFAFPVVLNVTFLPSFIFMSLIFSNHHFRLHQLQTSLSEGSASSSHVYRRARGEGVGLDHIKDLLSGRRSSLARTRRLRSRGA